MTALRIEIVKQNKYVDVPMPALNAMYSKAVLC